MKIVGVVLSGERRPCLCTEETKMGSGERELAKAAASLAVKDYWWLEEHRMLSHAGTDASKPVQETVSQESKPERKRRRLKREWPPVGTILEADYRGERYEAEVVTAPQLKSDKAVKVLTGPAAGEVCHSLTRAMLKATQIQRQAQNLGRTGVANGWQFWKVKD